MRDSKKHKLKDEEELELARLRQIHETHWSNIENTANHQIRETRWMDQDEKRSYDIQERAFWDRIRVSKKRANSLTSDSVEPRIRPKDMLLDGNEEEDPLGSDSGLADENLVVFWERRVDHYANALNRSIIKTSVASKRYR